MSARTVIVSDNQELIAGLVAHLGSDVMVFDDPVEALEYLRDSPRTEFVITQVMFANKQPAGLSLARVLRCAGLEFGIIFIGRGEHRHLARGLGEFLGEPVTPSQIGMVIEWLRGDAFVMLTRRLPATKG